MATESLCKKALDEHEKDLIGRSGVIGLGVIRISPSHYAVAVYVRKKLPLTRLSPNDVIPQTITVRGQRAPTKVIESGEVTLETIETT